jgi:hypothetical protein
LEIRKRFLPLQSQNGGEKEERGIRRANLLIKMKREAERSADKKSKIAQCKS